jgi:hypothetical protein
MTFLFDINKSIAATGYLINKAGGKWTVLFLVKALYYANRKSLVQYGRSITGDSLAAMANGPVVSNTYDLIKRGGLAKQSDLDRWRIFISERNGNFLRIVKEPDYGYLSPQEVRLLDDAFQVVSNVKETLNNWSHRYFPEWEDPGKGSTPIDPKTILSLEKIDGKDISKIEDEIASVDWLKAYAA